MKCVNRLGANGDRRNLRRPSRQCRWQLRRYQTRRSRSSTRTPLPTQISLDGRLQHETTPGHASKLFRIVVEESVEFQVRLAAAISLKRIVQRAWDPEEGASHDADKNRFRLRCGAVERRRQNPSATKYRRSRHQVQSTPSCFEIFFAEVLSHCNLSWSRF